tara:strand:+ start:1283 stop:1615 length:333 start_codon:yes stop_codon:yes gene_type:complete
MSLYFLLGTLTYAGQKMVRDNPDLIVAATRNIQIVGAEFLGQYGVLGKYDYLMMVEADDNDAVARLSLELGVRTGLHIETLPAIAIGAFTERTPDEPVSQSTSVRLSPDD